LSTSSLLDALRPALTPAAILIAAALAMLAGPTLPPSLAGLRVLGPGVLLLAGAAMSIWFNRGRAFIALASLFAAFAGYSIALEFGTASFAARAVYTGLALLVPLNVLLALAYTERGVFHHFNYRWPMIAVAEVLSVAWIASAGRSNFSGTAWHGLLDHWLLRSPPTPLAGRLIIAAALIAAVARAWPRHSPLDIGLAGALVAFLIACEWGTSPGAFHVFMFAAGVILLVSLLQESHRLAFRDELTGLPGRRALQERLSGLGPAYTIAMVDVDHFKQFNDTHGHGVGDQVLKLVAARLAQIQGGGTAYRYGGEEFAVLFPERALRDALPHLERMRAEIAAYRMTVRGAGRPKDPEAGSKRRAAETPGPQPDKVLSVTVSIGAAQRTKDLTTPSMVLHESDQALYRAKQTGRNKVCR
jgi:GGDEF domain-containing protein